MKMSMLISQAILETKLFSRSKVSLFWTMAFPIFFMVLFGLIYGNSNWAGMDMRSVDYLLPGIIVMGVMVTGIMHTVIGFVSEREKGVYRRLALTPLKRQTIIGGQMLHNYAIIIVQTLLLLVIGVIAFNIKITGNMLLFWLVLTVGAVSFMSIGFALTGLAKTYRSAMPINQIFYFILMFLGGVFFPNNMLPKFLGHIANILPSTHMNDALRAIFYQGAGFGDIWQHLLVLVGWSVVCLVISIRFFRWE
jgi:ABC-2 type transport system permease protein